MHKRHVASYCLGGQVDVVLVAMLVAVATECSLFKDVRTRVGAHKRHVASYRLGGQVDVVLVAMLAAVATECSLFQSVRTRAGAHDVMRLIA